MNLPQQLNFTAPEKHLLWVLCCIQVTHIIEFMVIMPLGPMIHSQIVMSSSQFGSMVAVYSVMAGVAGFFSAFFLQSYNRRTVLRFAYIGFLLATVATACAIFFEMLWFTRAIAGFFGGMLGGLVQVIVAEQIPFERRGRAMGLLMASFSVATVMGVPLSLFLANMGSWRMPLVVLSGVSLMVLIFSWRRIASLPAPLSDRSAFQDVVQTFKIPMHWVAFAFTACLSFSSFMIIPYITLYNVHNLHLSEHLIPYIYVCGGLATWFTGQWIGQLSDRYGKHRVLMIVLLLAIIPLMAFTHLVEQSFLLLLCITTLFFVFISGRNIPAMALITQLSPPEIKGRFLSIHTAVQSIMMGIAAFWGGQLITFAPDKSIVGFGLLGWFALGFSVLAMILTPFLKPTSKR